MTVAQYAKDHGVSKQSVYDKLRRGTLSYEVVDNIKHIVVSVAPDVVPGGFGSNLVPGDKLEKALKKLNKCKQKLLIERVKLKSMENVLAAKDAQIAALKVSMDFIESVVSKKLLVAPGEVIIDVPVKKYRNKKKKKKKK